MAKSIKELTQIETSITDGEIANLLFEAVYDNHPDNEGILARRVKFSELENFLVKTSRADVAPVTKEIKDNVTAEKTRVDGIIKNGGVTDANYFTDLSADLKDTTPANISIIDALNKENTRAKGVEGDIATELGGTDISVATSLAEAISLEVAKRQEVAANAGDVGDPLLDGLKSEATGLGANPITVTDLAKAIAGLYRIEKKDKNEQIQLSNDVRDKVGYAGNAWQSIDTAINPTGSSSFTVIEAINELVSLVSAAQAAADAVDNDTIERGTDGKLKVKAAGITEDKLDADAVTTDKIQNGAVTAAKLDAVVDGTTLEQDATTKVLRIKDDGVTTDKILNGAVTIDKLGIFTAIAAPEPTKTYGFKYDDTAVPPVWTVVELP
jgi:hypothetical protein